MQSEKVRSEFVIHWGDIFRHILKRWWIVLLCLIVGVAGGAAYGYLSYEPVYETQVVYIVSYSGAGESMGDLSSEYSLVQRVLRNCVIIGQTGDFSKALTKAVNEEAQANKIGERLQEGYVSSVVVYKNDAETSSERGTTLTISIQTDKAERSLRIAQALAKIYPQYVKDIYHLAQDQSLEFSLIDTPTEAKAPMEGSKTVMFGALMGIALAALAVVVLFFIALADNRIKTEEDIEDKYDIPVLGVIPRWEDIISIKGDK